MKLQRAAAEEEDDEEGTPCRLINHNDTPALGFATKSAASTSNQL